MFALNETALLRARTGRGGGRPTYAQPGTAFRCRSEPVRADAVRGDAVERGASLRLFAAGVDVRPGDRVELGGSAYRVAQVRRLRSLTGIHHLELILRSERCAADGG